MEGLGATIHHVYGLTETYRPAYHLRVPARVGQSVARERATVKARQGVPYIVAGMGMRVVDNNMHDVPRDGQTMGEVVMRGNNVMSGYFQQPDATEKAFEEVVPLW